MTKDEYKKEYIESKLVTWDKVGDMDLDFMYNHFHFIDSNIAEIFEVTIETVVRKRKELGISIKKDDYGAFKEYKQKGYLKWDEVNYARFDYLYNECNFTDGIIAGLFDVPQRTVTAKRKELGITLFGSSIDRNDVSSYLDFVFADSPKHEFRHRDYIGDNRRSII